MEKTGKKKSQTSTPPPEFFGKGRKIAYPLIHFLNCL